MAKNTNTFQNDIKNYEIIRDLIRHIYMYGNYSKKEIVKNEIVGSERSLYDILKRIENYLDGEYLEIHKLPNRKTDKNGYRFKYDPFLCPVNYLADTYKNCSYVVEDFIFYFTLMQAFTNDEYDAYEHFEKNDYTDETSELDLYSVFDYDSLIGNIIDVYQNNEKLLQTLGQSCSSDINIEDIFTPTKVRDRLNELVDLGIIQKNGSSKYSFAPDLFEDLDADELNDLQLMTQFFYNYMFLTVPGYYLSATIDEYIQANYSGLSDESETFFTKQENPVFFYKNNRLQNVIDDNIFWDLLLSIHNMSPIIFKYRNKLGIITDIEVFPIMLVIDKQYGRQYLYSYNYVYGNYNLYRLNAISNVECSKKHKKDKFAFLDFPNEPTHADIRAIYKKNFNNVWNISTCDELHTVLLHFTFPEKEYSKLYHQLITTGRNGVITPTDTLSFDYSISVQSELEMVPWIRSWGPYVMVDRSTNPELFNKIQKDYEEGLKLYGAI